MYVTIAAMRRVTRNYFIASILFGALFMAFGLRADQLQMVNGDHYAGKILSVSSNSVVFESDVLGKVTLPREKVLSMSFAASGATNTPVVPRVLTGTKRGTNANVNIAVALRNGTNAAAIEQIRQQMLAGTTPEANQKYDELLSGLMSGKVSVSDIRTQAKASINQINKLKTELGPQADPMLDAYLEILQNFVNEAEPTAPAKPVLPAPPAGIAAPASPAGSFGTNSPAK
jgi:hypothetical protein